MLKYKKHKPKHKVKRPYQQRVLRKAFDEKKLKPVQENIDAQRLFIQKSDALNNRIYANKMHSLGMGLSGELAARKTLHY